MHSEMDIKNTKISTRLAWVIGVAVVLLLTMLWIGTSQLLAVNHKMGLITGVLQPKINHAKDLTELLRSMDVSLRDIVLLNDETAMLKEIEHFKSLQAKYSKAELDLMADQHHPEAVDRLQLAQQSMKSMEKPLEKAIRLGSANKPEEATRVLLDEIRPLANQTLSSIDAVTKVLIMAGEDARNESEKTYRHALLGLSVTGAAATVLLLVFGWWLARSITHPLNSAVKLAGAIAAGDLSQSIQASGRSETDLLLHALKTMQSGLVSVVQGVREKAENVATGSSQISQGNNDLAVRTERQASTLAQAASSMKQLRMTVEQNANNAQQADELVTTVSTVATRGAQAVSRVVETMSSITANSRLISDIISVIDGIAFQTNILALNASVEAARAGEQGRGFSVVAEEVRTLAQRSATASKEISDLITASVQGVERGTRQVENAHRTMDEMTASVQSLRTLMREINELSAAQSSDLSQVVGAVVQMDNDTQQNAALVEESAAAAESLKRQAEQLVEAVAFFYLGRNKTTEST
jgi:methyl-accepting chemotaxis protein